MSRRELISILLCGVIAFVSAKFIRDESTSLAVCVLLSLVVGFAAYEHTPKEPANGE